MAQFVEVTLDDSVIRFETDKGELSGEIAVSNLPQKVADMLPELQSTIQGVTKLVSRAIHALEVKPAETVVEFGVKVSAELGVMVATSSAEAQIKMSMKWVKDGKP